MSCRREMAGPGAQGETDPEFTPTREPGCQQQVGDVRRADQQHGDHGAEQHPELRTYGPDDHFAIQPHVDAVIAAELLRQGDADATHLARGLLNGHAGLHPRVRDEEMTAPPPRIERHGEGGERFGPPVVERRRHDADDLVGLAIERHRLTENRRILREASHPQPVRQHHDLSAVRLVFVFGEPSSERGLHAEDIRQRRRRPHGLQPHRIAGARQHVALPHRAADDRKHLAARLPVVVLGERRRAGGARGLGVVDDDQAVGIGIRQRFQEDAVEDAEDCRGDTDPQRKSHDGQAADQRRAAAASGGVTKILYESRHAGAPAGLDGIAAHGVGYRRRRARRSSKSGGNGASNISARPVAG
jgi:hypothetical protein